MDEFKCPQNTLDSLIATLYPGISDDTLPSDQYFTDRCILSAWNEDVHSINAQVLNTFPGEERIYQSADWVASENDDDISSIYPASIGQTETQDWLSCHCSPKSKSSTGCL